MTRYIVRRILQAIPLLLIISFILFALANKMGDPLASFGGRRRVRSSDRERLTRQLGLDKPILVQYVIWLVGNDWMKIEPDQERIASLLGKELDVSELQALALDLGIDYDSLPGQGRKVKAKELANALQDRLPELVASGQKLRPELAWVERGARKGVLRGDFGRSFMEKRPVLELIQERIPNTLILMLTAEVVIWVFALLIGIYSALRQYSVMDYVFTAFSFIGYSMPVFWLALMCMFIFAVNFKKWGLPYFPTVGMYDLSVGKTLPQVLWHLTLPVVTVSTISIAGYSRFVRSQMLEVVNQDYIRTARAKGLPQRQVIVGHALKNAALPLVTLIGLDLPFLFSGAVVTESIFAWPGMGRLFWDAAQDTDIPVLMGILLIISALVVFFQLLTDITYTFLDPRIRYD
jgi:peptide/nickel transport system permease protein